MSEALYIPIGPVGNETQLHETPLNGGIDHAIEWADQDITAVWLIELLDGKPVSVPVDVSEEVAREWWKKHKRDFGRPIPLFVRDNCEEAYTAYLTEAA